MGEAVLYAYSLAGIRRTALTQQHFEDARMATNTLMGRWSADGVNLWQVDLQTINLQQGVSTYQVPSNTIVMLDAYYTIGAGAAEIDRIMTPISRSGYASYPNKQQQGACTVHWFDRLLAPTVTLWPVPDGQQSYFKYYRLRQTQDSNLQGAQQVEIPIYFLESYCFGLAHRLALIWNPEKAPALKVEYAEAWGISIRQNVESSNSYISPALNGYYR